MTVRRKDLLDPPCLGHHRIRQLRKERALQDPVEDDAERRQDNEHDHAVPQEEPPGERRWPATAEAGHRGAV
jgi:hypothetical protein